MYNHFQLAVKYLHYYLTASSGKGHGIHSPFVFDLVDKVLSNTAKTERADEIESLRRSLLRNNTSIDVEDLGAGSAVVKSNRRLIKQIAASALKPKKYAALLARLAKHYKPQTIIELGTSLGISTAYLAAANPSSNLYTLEGCAGIAAIAQHNFEKLGLQNIQLIHGSFESALPALLDKIPAVNLAFVDGNHRELPTLNYFNRLLVKATDTSIFIFDDIHWSKEMEAAWKQIQRHPSVTLSIDLFFIGLVFFSSDFKEKQHFAIRF